MSRKSECTRRGPVDKLIRDITNPNESGWLINHTKPVKCQVYLSRKWMKKKDAEELYEFLVNSCEFKQERAKIGINEFDVPRLQFYCGDDTSKSHRYRQGDKKGTKLNEWIPELKDIRDRVEDETGIHFDSCLVNYYRNGEDYIGFHGDKEVEPPLNPVFTLSLGVSRRFIFRPYENTNSSEDIEIQLHSGNAILMLYETQKQYKHGIPKQLRIKEGRISVTFRVLA